ncbi:MAG: FKBP-type peptidyl-prolyl cis-trans isomerase [Bacteroidota bacterium]
MKKQLFSKRALMFFFIILIFEDCNKNDANNQGYSKDKNGNYFKLLTIGDGEIFPTDEYILKIKAELKTQRDSIFFTSDHQHNDLIIDLRNPFIKDNYNIYFSKLVVGDSASFLIPPKLFFKSFFNTNVPNFCIMDSIIKFNFKLNAILSQEEYRSLLNEKLEDKELQELRMIDNFLKHNYPKVKPNKDGVYVLEKKSTSFQKVKHGNRITVNYQGFFLDGKLLDAHPQQIEFNYGLPDQFVNGLNIFIGSLKKGEFSKIIVPSRLAFGELGNSNQLVKPYTPLVYNIKVIDIK